MRSLMRQCSNGRSWSLQTKTYVILVTIIVISGWTLLINIDVTDFDVYFNNKFTSSDAEHSVDLGPLEPAVTSLDPNTKYLSYLPHAGLSNQVISLHAAGLAAQELNRTLILPPIMSNVHDHDNTHQRWSRYFNLPRFTYLTGVPIVEWDQVRPLTPAQRKAGRDQATLGNSQGDFLETDEWARVAENLTCQIIWGYGTPPLEINHSSWNFVWHFLFRPVLKKPPPPVPGMPDLSLAMVTGNPEAPDELVAMDDIVARYRDNEEQMLVLSHTFKIVDPNHKGHRIWDEIGANLHFIPQLMDYTTSLLNEELQHDQGTEVLLNDDPEEKEVLPKDEGIEPIVPTNKNPNATDSGDLSNPGVFNITAPATRIPYIALHLRRDDIGNKCTKETMSRCIVPMELYEDAVGRARASAAARGLHSRLPVVVTTDTTSQDDIQRMEQLGWHRIDHSKYKTTQLWGAFGGVMVDAAILALADEFVGSPVSSMTRITARRRTAWYHRAAHYPEAEPTPKKRGALEATA
ncbi:hypothetical protein BGX26_004717 [Mortierella sp. AD094]|nr:hypothetical protein BGX26_004717 [Mortierella sp. AD094]